MDQDRPALEITAEANGRNEGVGRKTAEQSGGRNKRPLDLEFTNPQDIAETVHLCVHNRLIVGEYDCQHRNPFIIRIFAILAFLDAELRFSRLETHHKSALRSAGRRKCPPKTAPDGILRHHLSPNGMGRQKCGPMDYVNHGRMPDPPEADK